jgi:NAD(P)-dependent dehydrogenase (short-subunit alcohol dehydrogenase family)
MGLAMAKRFAAEGAKVIAADWNAERLDAALEDIRGGGGTILGAQGNIADQATAEGLIGLALGSALSAFAIAAQNAVPLEQTGVATALGTFARSIGSTVTSAGGGGLLAANIGTTAATSIPPLVLAGALHNTFLASVVIVGTGALVSLMPADLPFTTRASRSQAASSERSSQPTTHVRAAVAVGAEQRGESIGEVECRASHVCQPAWPGPSMAI